MARRRVTRRGRGEGTVSERPDGTWIGQVTTGYTEEGKQKRKTVYGKTQAEALAKLAEIKQQLVSGTYADTDLTLAGYLNTWLEQKSRQIKPRTAFDYRYDVEKYILPRIGRVKLAKLTPITVQNALLDLADKVSPDRANKARRTLYGALKQAVRLQLIPRNPCDAIDPLKQSKRDMTLWTSQEAVRFLDVSRVHRLYALFYLALSTGMRRGELLGMRWSDLEGSTVRVRQNIVDVQGVPIISTPKTVKGMRRITITPDVLRVLDAHRNLQSAERVRLGAAWPEVLTVQQQGEKGLEPKMVVNDLMFTSEVGGVIHPRNLSRTWYALQGAVRRAWRKVLEEQSDTAGLALLDAGKLFPTVRFHDLRHLNVSVRRKLGQDAKLIADQIGHTDPAFTMRLYTHLFEEDRQAAGVNLLEAFGSGDAPLN